MQRLAGCLFQALNFVLHHQFPALQFDNLQVVGGEMDKSLVQLVLQDLVLTLELNKMRLHTHAKPPRSKLNLSFIRTNDATPAHSAGDGELYSRRLFLW